ncbi:NUDIX domain-containing protein [Streptomyces sp. 3MP-14]|uniref:NUDIX domain-containing protein n=1 Tax=Streptomyces mimosae TaxID=2586635 RepID=A0A5N6AFQ2_9ACTN|nr:MULTISPECIES: NUDIX hydrolase [Streptomyces]KAB8167075.1 NUDIX domain-containing protein [Streptomyces mimosae]KAB8177016.1 NUDIX domain-containing protein [Streptomyces sp. 3MP-14]
MAHADIDPAAPPARRIGALVYLEDPDGRVLLVQPTYKEGGVYQLPGGGAHADQPSYEAAERELLEETGLSLQVTGVVVAGDWVPARAAQAEGYNTVYTIGRQLTPAEAAQAAIPEPARDELSDLRFVALADVDELCAPYQSRRIHEAQSAVAAGRVLPVLRLGERARDRDAA